VDLLSARLGVGGVGRSRSVVSSLVVSVGTDNDDLESILALTHVGSRLLLDILTPERALEAGDGVGLVAGALARVPLGVALDEKVEASAGAGRFALSSASIDIVASKLVVSKVTGARHGAAQVAEGLSPAIRSAGGGSKLVETSMALEGVNGVGLDLGAVGVGLAGTWVVRVNETTVGANLDVSSASGVRSEGVGVGPINGFAARRGNIGGLWVGRRSLGRSRSSSLGRYDVVIVVEEEPASLKVSLSRLSSGSTSGSSGSSVLSSGLVVDTSLNRSTNTDRRALGQGHGDAVERADIESLGCRRSSNKGSGPEKNVGTHLERM
jgi:hypothetical protein